MGRRYAAWTETEAGFLQAVRELARACGWTCYHQRPALTRRGWRTALMGTSGYPDLTLAKGRCGTRAGRLLIVELKSERGALSPDQRHWKDILETIVGVEYYLWRPSDWDEIVHCLRG